VTNLILAVLFTLTLVPMAYIGDPAEAPDWLRMMMTVSFFGIFVNLVLAFFNLIPIPPLDGSHVVRHMLPKGLQAGYQAMGQVGILILMAIMLAAPGSFNFIMVPVNFLTEVLFSAFGLSGLV
jgi:Zn-dependent protease